MTELAARGLASEVTVRLELRELVAPPLKVLKANVYVPLALSSRLQRVIIILHRSTVLWFLKHFYRRILKLPFPLTTV